MDRLNQLRVGADASRGGDSTLDTSSPPSEAYMSANESTSKYFSLSDSTFDISPIKDVSLASAASAVEPDHTLTDPDKLLSNLSPIIKKDVMLDSYKIGKEIEAANILSGGVDIFEDNDNSFDGDELVIDDNVDMDDKSNLDDKSLEEVVSEATLLETHVDLSNKDTEVVLQIDGKNVDAIDIGNGLYLYRKAGHDELAAVQIITEEGQLAPSFKFLKVRENVEGNLEVYEEFEIEVSKEVPVNEAKLSAKKTPRTPVKETSKVINESSSKIAMKHKTPPKEVSTSSVDVKTEVKEPESKSELNLNGKMMKFNESRKSPVVGSFTPMTYHSTPNKEGKPLTKTMVDQQLDPSRHSDNVKKTIEVHTDNQTKKLADESSKQKTESQKKVSDNMITSEISSAETETVDKQNLEENTDASTNNADKAKKEELQEENVAKMLIDNPAKINVDSKIPTKINNVKAKINVDSNISTKTVEEAKVIVDNKPLEKSEGTLQRLEVEIKDSNNKEDVFSPKLKGSDVSAKIITELVTASVLEDSAIQGLKSKSDIAIEQSINVLDINKFNETDTNTINDDNSSANIAVIESIKPKMKKVDIQEKLTEVNEQKLEVKSYEKVQEIATSTKNLLSTIQNEEIIKQNMKPKESLETISIEPTQILQSTESWKESEPDNKKQIEDKTVTVGSIPKSNELETTSKIIKESQAKEVDNTKETGTEKINETKQNTNEAEKSCHATNMTEVKTEEINSIIQVNEPDVKESESKLNSSTEFANLVENKTDLKTDLLPPTIPKDIVSKMNTEHTKLQPVAVSVESNTNKQPVDKIIDETTSSKTEKLSTNVHETKLECKTGLESKMGEKKYIPVVHVPKSATKFILLNSTERKVEPATVSQNFKIITDLKAYNPMTYSKAEKPKVFKEIEAKLASKLEVVNPTTEGFELKTVPKAVLLNPVSKGIEPKNLKSEKSVPIASQIPKSNVVIITSNKVIVPSKMTSLGNVEIKIPTAPSISVPKPINNNHAAVPFGKWTDANRQEFLNKFKDIKVPATSNTKQIKNSNDLNRIDVLKKIDSQRSTAKGQDKLNIKDTVFSSKIAPPKVETKIPIRNEGLKVKAKPECTTEKITSTVSVNTGVVDKPIPEPEERREVNVNDLIGRAIVDMLNRPVPMPMTRSPLDEPRQVDNKEAHIPQTEANTDQKKLKPEQPKANIDQQKLKSDPQKLKTDPQGLNLDKQKPKSDPHKLKIDSQVLNIESQKQKSDPQKLDVEQQKQNTDQPKQNTEQLKQNIDEPKLNNDQQKLNIEQQKLNTDQQKLNIEQKVDEDSSGSLDDIEMKMNELHGIPFVERPPHELPRVHKTYSKSKRNNKSAKNLPATSKESLIKGNVIDLESDDEVIEHEPITGDIDLSKKTVSKSPALVKSHDERTTVQTKEPQKIEPVFTENDFDKFARRNSITYENYLTVNFDGTVPANVVQTVKEKDASKVYHKTEMMRTEATTKKHHKKASSQIAATKIPNPKPELSEESNIKNYQSKIHSAYQSVLTAKLQMDRPITIIEDKPVKVVFMESNAEFVPNQLNVQGKELSPAKKTTVESTKVSPQAVSSDVTDTIDDKQQDDSKIKTKHQRKQVLTPVEAPDLELIQPGDLGLNVSPKKKRKTDDNKTDKSLKNLVHKKSYLLGRAHDEKNTQEVINPIKETINHPEIMTERTVSAIDNLVKAAELLENQSVQRASSSPDSQQNTPAKRGRGRPRKYPLPDETPETKAASPSPQKKPRLIDTKPVKKPDSISDIDNSDEEQMIRENWTMGKINENIVCPICNKLFRSENVVFKHVKHCTGVSPTRSELEKRSPRRRRYSKESDNKSFDSKSDDMDFDEKPKEIVKSTPKKRKSKESVSKLDEVDVIVIEDTPVKELVTEKEPMKKVTEEKQHKTKIVKTEPTNETTDKNQEKPQTVIEEIPVREKTLKEISDEKAAEAINSQKVSVDKIDKTETVEEKAEKSKTKKNLKTTVQTSNLVCEFCGKTFRQLSYLANHKLQHKREQLKKLEAKLTAKLQVFNCEVCNKEFRTLHHLVQHKISHNPDAPARSSRKSSSERSETKVKELPMPKQNEDTSAGFRCEPCDKSFRKLHHLVEHRETHDGINRQKTNAQTVAPPIEKPPPPPQCDICKKTFRKLHHLIEHKEQHNAEQVETSSEKSDDKSVLSSLSTRDIIHECSLCYMVFPNEHSLKKHFIICQQKKKRQSKPKDKPENVDGVDIVEDSTNTEDSMDVDDEPKIVTLEIIDDDKEENEQENNISVPKNIEKKRVSEKLADTKKTFESEKIDAVSEIPVPIEKEVTELKSASIKRELPKSEDSPDAKKVIPEKIKKIDDQEVKELQKKTLAKDKVAITVTKRQKSIAPLPVLPEGKPVESSDDDEVRYMLNPNFNVDETSPSKVFLKVRSNKRNSLQIERSSSRELINRRTSLQHPPKIPRLKAKAIVPKAVPTVTKNVPKPTKLKASTDSDDSDVKYSFPEVTKPTTKLEHTPKEKKIHRKSLADKRKSLGGIAKRKSMGQTIAKNNVNPSPVRVIKRRTLDVEHRCDCGQLFNSAALLTRHTSLAHTPPRIRRRRSPPPEPSAAKTSRKSTSDQPAKATRKSIVKCETSNSKPTRKSSAKSDTPETRKSKEEDKSSAKPRRTPAHRGVPVPEKMRKLMMKIAK